MTSDEFREKLRVELQTNGVLLIDLWSQGRLFIVHSKRGDERSFHNAFALHEDILRNDPEYVLTRIISVILSNDFPDNVPLKIERLENDRESL